MISTNSEIVTPSKATVVSRVEVRDINRVIESILPKTFTRILAVKEAEHLGRKLESQALLDRDVL